MGTLIRTLMMVMVATVTLTTGQARAQATDGTEEIVHQVPTMAVSIDGVKHKPEKVREYDGRPLYTVVDSRTHKDGLLRIFTSARKAEAYMAKAAKPATRTGSISTMGSNDSAPSGVVEVYEHINWDGQLLIYNTTESEEDFSWTCETWWGTCVNFNDKTSSISNESDKRMYLAEHHWYGGSRLYLEPKSYHPNLVNYGWNDRASSLGW